MSKGANWVELAVTATIGAATITVALLAWATSIEALYRTHLPVLRPLPFRVAATGAIHPADLLLKTSAPAPAVAVMMFEDRRQTQPVVLTQTDFIEPLGPMPEAGETAPSRACPAGIASSLAASRSHVPDRVSGHCRPLA